MHYLIKDIDFQKIMKILRKIKGIHKANAAKIRKFLEAIYFICKGGCHWRLLPYYLGHWRAVHKRFKEWETRGIWKYLFEELQEEPDMEWIVIDATIVRAHACAAGYKKDSQQKEALGRSRGGFSTKIHALVDALGNPLKFILTPGQQHEVTKAKELIEGILDASLLADTAYSAQSFRDQLKNQSCQAIIPFPKNSKKPVDHDRNLYEHRHVIECFFGKIKHFRRVFSRFDKTASSFLAFLHFTGVFIWLR
jgi:transposase